MGSSLNFMQTIEPVCHATSTMNSEWIPYHEICPECTHLSACDMVNSVQFIALQLVIQSFIYGSIKCKIINLFIKEVIERS